MLRDVYDEKNSEVVLYAQNVGIYELWRVLNKLTVHMQRSTGPRNLKSAVSVTRLVKPANSRR